MSNIEIKIAYSAKMVIGGFVGEVVGRLIASNNEGPISFTFDTPFATREEAAADAKRRMIEAFSAGEYRGY